MQSQRFKFTISYDGTRYAGWQIQPNGVTVQEKIQDALREMMGGAVKIHGSGRTDQGVHARGQVAHADLPRMLPSRALRNGLNALLPSDIRILVAERVAGDFHARRSAVGKEYRYFIWNGDLMPPFLRHYRSHVRNPLDVEAMREAAHLLEGRHDFAAFTANPNRVVESTVRSVRRVDVRKRGHDYTIIAEGEGFLYRMVRSMAGWLIRVGEGRAEPARTRDILASRQRTARVPTAPAEGLFLWRVHY